METVLHIGLEKTGTTTIQLFLDANRAALADRQRIAVTRSAGIGNSRDLATYAIRDNEFNDDHLIELAITDHAARESFRRRVKSRFVADLDRLASGCDRLVLSSEHLQSRLKLNKELVTLRELLSSSGLRVTMVLVYLRDPARLIQSMYSTALKVGHSTAPPVAPNNEHWNHICDHRATLERWSAVFADAQIVPRLFAPDQLLQGDLLTDFCGEVQIEPIGLRTPSPQNRSLDADGQALLRYVNEAAPWLMERDNQKVRREVVEFLSQGFSGPSPLPSAALVETCEQRFGESNEWVRRRYFPHLDRLFEPVHDDTERHDEDESDARRARLARAERWLADRTGLSFPQGRLVS